MDLTCPNNQDLILGTHQLKNPVSLPCCSHIIWCRTCAGKALLQNGKMCLAGCGRAGISLSELKPSLEVRDLLQAVNLSNQELQNVVIVEEEASIASTDEETLAEGEKSGPKVPNIRGPSSYQSTSAQIYDGVERGERQQQAYGHSNKARVVVRERQDSGMSCSSGDSSLPENEGRRCEKQNSSMASRSPEFKQDGDGFRRVRLLTEENAAPLREGGCQEQRPSGKERLGFHSGQDYQGQNVPRGERVNNGDLITDTNRERQAKCLLPEYNSWESGRRVQKNNNPGFKSLRFEGKRREASATSSNNTSERETGRHERSRSRDRYKERKQGRDRSREKTSRGSEDRGRSREKGKIRSREKIRSRSRDGREKNRSRSRNKPALSVDCREDVRRSRGREGRISRSREGKSQSRPKSHTERNYRPVQRSSRDKSRSREEARSRSKDLGRSRSSERVRSKSGQTAGSQQDLKNFSRISSNCEDKGDGDDKRKETSGEANSKKGVQWKWKGEVGAGREAKAPEVVKSSEETKSQMGEQSAVKMELVERGGKRLKQDPDETPVEKCTLTKTQVKRELKAPELIDLGEDDDNNSENPCDMDNNFLKKQLTEYIEEEKHKDESLQDSPDSPDFSFSSIYTSYDVGVVPTAQFLEENTILGGEQVWTKPDDNLRRLSISSDSRPQEDEIVTDLDENGPESLREQAAVSLKLVSIESMKPEEVVVVQGGCICDKFEYRPPSSSWGTKKVICDEHRSHQTKIVGMVSKSANSHTFLAELSDEDGVLAGRSVKFCPNTLPGIFVQLRKVYHKKYILLAVDCPWDTAEEVLTHGQIVGLCQAWVGPDVDDLAPILDISLTCENMESDADGVLSLGCSTPLKPGRSVPFVVFEHSSRLKILAENRLCTVNKNGNCSLTCRDHPELGSQSIESLKGSEIGRITNVLDNEFMEAIIKKVLLKNMGYVKKGPSKKLSMKTNVPIQRKTTLKSPARMKFGVKTAIKVKQAGSTSSSNIFGNDDDSDGETCSNSSYASSSQASSKSVNSLGVGGNSNRNRGPRDPAKLVKDVKKNCALHSVQECAQCPTLNTGKAIPTIMNTHPVSAIPSDSILSTSVSANQAPLLPDLSKPPPTAELNRPAPIPDLRKPPTPTFFSIKTPLPVAAHNSGAAISNLTPEQSQLRANSQHAGSQPLPCNLCQLNRNSDIVFCPSCPRYTVILDQDLSLPPDTPVVGEVKVDGLTDGPFVKIFSLGGTIHIPNSLNLAFSHNPDATPKRIDDTVTMNFLNTGLNNFLLKKGTPVTRAQLLRLGN